MPNPILTTAPSMGNKRITTCLGVVSGEAITGANAVVGTDLDYEMEGTNGSMLMATAPGTAVITE